MNSLPAEPQGKPKNTRVGSLSLLFVLPNPDTKQGSPALQVDSLPTELPGKPFNKLYLFMMIILSYVARFNLLVFYLELLLLINHE